MFSRLAMEFSWYGIFFGPLECKLIVHHCQEHFVALILGDEISEIAQSPLYPANCTTDDSCVRDEKQKLTWPLPSKDTFGGGAKYAPLQKTGLMTSPYT